jgi:hypothetical protein
VRFYLLLFFVAMLFAVALSTTSGTDEPTATRVLQESGYKNIQVIGHRFSGCSFDDAYSTEFTATSLNGLTVAGVVCTNNFGGSHIRLD